MKKFVLIERLVLNKKCILNQSSTHLSNKLFKSNQFQIYNNQFHNRSTQKYVNALFDANKKYFSSKINPAPKIECEIDVKFVNKQPTGKHRSQHEEQQEEKPNQFLNNLNGSLRSDNSKRQQEKHSKTDEDQSVNTIDLNKELDKKRQEIGFETESLLDTDWRQVKVDYNKLLVNYAKLSKKNLTALVVATTMMGCVMAPIPFDPYIFLYTTLGTTLTSASANTFNQFLEVPYDSQMSRTKDRVLVRGNLTPLHAFTFATISGVSGLCILYNLVNPLTALLGASSLVLYTSIYTPLKRLSVLNTWIGSVVGAIPPLMGYTAMTGQIEPAGLLMAAILYSWQFPHFHALSWNLRGEYSRAGYRMISILNPRVCTSSSLNHTLLLTLMCSYLAPVYELTTWNFAIDSLPLNLYFIYLAIQFKIKEDAQSSRKLFRYSLIYLPFVILLMFITKYPNREDNKKTTSKLDYVPSPSALQIDQTKH